MGNGWVVLRGVASGKCRIRKEWMVRSDEGAWQVAPEWGLRYVYKEPNHPAVFPSEYTPHPNSSRRGGVKIVMTQARMASSQVEAM